MPTPDTHACDEYNQLSRRHFMAATAGGAAAFLAANAALPRIALARDHRGTMRDVVVSIYLRGASDGLTMVPPHAEPRYYQVRPNLSVPQPGAGTPNDAIDLDGFFGLAPALAPLLPAYQDGKLLIVHATGSTDPSRSHFDAQRFMEVGLPNEPTLATGWLGRHLYSIDPMDPAALLRAIGISNGLQRTLVGAPLALPVPNLDTFGLTGAAGTVPARSDAIGDMYALVDDPIMAAATTTLATINLLNTINFAGYAPAGGATDPVGSLGNAMKQTAALIKAQVGVEAIAIDVGGWDTHNNQGNFTGTMANLMATLASTLAAFYTDMTAGMAPSFTLVVMSEFGRRFAENGSGGSDHGHGNAMFVMGNCVHGGRVLTQWPGLQPEQLFQGIDLDVTIDYRDILAEIVQQRLGNANLPFVFPSFTPTPRAVFAC
jgi:uncharacterized protein (DUF1501 family)